MQPNQESLIMIDISFGEFLEQFNDQSTHSSLKFIIILSGQITDEQYIVFNQQTNASFLSEFGLTPEQSIIFHQKCEEYRKRYKAHTVVYEMFKRLGIYEFLQQIESEYKQNKLFSLLTLCGEISDTVFSDTTSSNMLFNEFELEGEDITTFQQICISYREEYKHQNIVTSLAQSRDGFQFTFRELS
jgi:hypothetical protein